MPHPSTIVRAVCSDVERQGAEFDLLVELRPDSAIGLRTVRVLSSPHLRYGRLIRHGEPPPKPMPRDERKLKNFRFADDYKGCPYCTRKDFYLCGCGAVSCAESTGFVTRVPCGRCGEKSLAVKISFISGVAREDK